MPCATYSATAAPRQIAGYTTYTHCGTRGPPLLKLPTDSSGKGHEHPTRVVHVIDGPLVAYSQESDGLKVHNMSLFALSGFSSCLESDNPCITVFVCP